MAVAHSWQLTYEDFLNFPDDGKRHELVEGEHYVTPAPSVRHQQVVLRLAGALLDFARSTGSGEVFVAPIDVVLSDVDVVEPDLLWISSARRDILTAANVQGAPDLVVEVLSPGTRRTDEVTKRKLYDRFGVAEYWIVDPELERVRVLRRDGLALVQVAELEREDHIGSPLLPGFDLALADVFG